MNGPKDSQDDQDPDYASSGPSDEAQQKLYEETARATVARKITAIVDKEFSKEIDTKEKEILQIEGRLHKALKTLHFLRYVIITDFYNRKQCLAVQGSGELKQTRIHPAIKQMIGKSPRISQNTLSPGNPGISLNSKDPGVSKDGSFNPDIASIKKEIDSTSETEKRLGNVEDTSENDLSGSKRSAEKRQQEDDVEDSTDSGPPKKVPRYVPPKSGIPEPQVPSRGARHKVRKRIVVGNISKWIPPDWREDAASHKWTMYVRGSKENPDIGDFVGKIRFFLHPSYRPNDVVEVTSPPFHLSRRGWGEFPLRVQLHFKNAMNKPMDIIHYLKLDRTYTGLQTLGSETVVDVWIKIGPEAASSSDSRTVEELKRNSGNCSENTDYTEMAKNIKSEPKDTEISWNSEDHNSCNNAESETSDCCEENEKEIDKKEESLSRVHFEHDYANFTNGNSMNNRDIERNITISHSPERNDATDETNTGNVRLVSEELLNVLSTDGEISRETENSGRNIGEATLYEEVVTTSEKRRNEPEKIGERIAETMMNGNCTGKRELTTISDNGEPEITIEAWNPSSEHEEIDKARMQSSTDVRKMASELDDSSPKLQPLRIAIPAAFEALRRSRPGQLQKTKQILVLKNNKLIPVNAMTVFSGSAAGKSNEMSLTTSTETITTKTLVGVQRGVSLLKKSATTSNATLGSNPVIKNDGRMIIKLNPSNSLLLNATNNIPALQIADPSGIRRIPQRLYLVEKKQPHRSSVGILSKAKSKSKEQVPDNWLDNYKLVTKPKITLGKDKIRVTSRKENYEETLRSIDDANIAEVQAFVRFAIRRIPLISEKATDPEFRSLHPYACATEQEFLNHNVGKQRALEWYRAKRVRAFMQKKGIPEDLQWSVKEIMIWARLHGHTPIRSFTFGGICSRGTSDKSSEKNLPDETSETSVCTVTAPDGLLEYLRNAKETTKCLRLDDKSNNDLEIIDVENIVEKDVKSDRRKSEWDSERTKSIISIGIPEKIVGLQTYVCDTARQIGVKLGPQEIVPGVTHCAPARMIVRAIQCLVEDLLRSSYAKAWQRNGGGGCPDTITLEDVRSAIVCREEFDIFTNEGLGSSHCTDD